MELPSKLVEQIAFNTRTNIVEHILTAMDKFTHEEHLSQSLQINNKQFKLAVTFWTGYNDLFNVTDKNNKFYFMKSISDEDSFIQTTIPPGAYELKCLNKEINRIITEEEHYTEGNYPFKKTKFLNTGINHRDFATRSYKKFYVWW